ncbi:hypothetical protein I3843_02G021300 [Carya illinoinensis]|nr:hypothetical protein I3843_02G021300 [Carya illinoinensis]KAG7990336.1 hypothetical protein I3843_02G021300 [Carya illinoinensis]
MTNTHGDHKKKRQCLVFSRWRIQWKGCFLLLLKGAGATGGLVGGCWLLKLLVADLVAAKVNLYCNEFLSKSTFSNLY